MWPFKSKTKVTLHDPVFGLIEWDSGIWTALPVEPESGHMTGVVASAQGPSDQQRQFYLELKSSLPELVKKSLGFMSTQATFKVDVSRLELYGVGIGSNEECVKGDFDLEFSDSEAKTIYCVFFENHEPAQCGWED
jgi:hypothetical protein